jgi:AAA+ superfamily predicted ATPase
MTLEQRVNYTSETLIEDPGERTMDEARLWFEYHTNLYNHMALMSVHDLSDATTDSIRNGLGGDNYFNCLKNCRALDDHFGQDDVDDLEELEAAFKKHYNNSDQQLRGSFIEVFLAAMAKKANAQKNQALNSSLEANFQAMSESLDLDKVEFNLAKLLFMIHSCRELYNYLERDLLAFSIIHRPILSTLLEATRDEVNSALSGRLSELGFINANLNSLPRLDESFYRLLEFPDPTESLECLVPAQPPVLAETDFFLDNLTLEALKLLIVAESKTPTHILFYGPPGVGKTQLARFLAHNSPGQGFEVKPDVRDNIHRANLIVAHNFARKEPGHLLIVDEADKLLESKNRVGLMFFFGGDTKPQKVWLDYFLEKKGPTCLWIVNDARLINSSVIRRFAFSVKFEKLGARSRLKIWRGQQSESDIDLLSENSLRLLAKEYDVSPGVIAQAFEKTVACGFDSDQTAHAWLKKQLRAHLELSGQKNCIIKVPPQYRVEVLSCDPPIGNLLATIKSWRDRALELPIEDRQAMKLLFYGPPGVGKTELANYLAQELDLDFTRARVSDIISPYVGQSEINLARLFQRHKASLGIVLIDEVESFLYNRDMALRTWEMSLVNEFLTCLDQFKGLFIGTTNRPGHLDPAARRRLGRKVEFGPLGQTGRVELFEAFLAPISGKELSVGEMKDLERLGFLVPSDYVVVAELMSYGLTNELDNLSLIAALEREANSRLDQWVKVDNPVRDEPERIQRLIN